MDQKSYEQFSFNKESLRNKTNFLKEGMEVEIINFNNQPINIELPPKTALEVKRAPPNIRGNTAQGGSKQIVLETGAKVTVPLFIKEGDRIKINTKTGEYVERV